MWMAFAPVVPLVLTLLSPESMRKPPAAYCGIECVYAASRLLGREAAFTALLRPAYVGARTGSSLEELRRAAHDCGLSAAPIRHANTRVLRACPHPVVLHVRSSLAAGTYNHYMLFLGTRGGRAALFDPPHPVRYVPWPEIAALWDGNGLVISATPIGLAPILAPARRRVFLGAAVLLVAMLSAREVKRRLALPAVSSRRSWAVRSVAQGIALGSVAVLGGFLYHGARAEGLLANTQATQGIQQAHAADFLRRVAEPRVLRWLDAGVVLVDARLPHDYRAGHLAGALNVPVDVNESTRRRTMSAVSADATIVVYCQSRACKFAEKVAIDLIRDGFSHVAVYRDGWNDWVSKHPQRKSTAPRANTESGRAS